MPRDEPWWWYPHGREVRWPSRALQPVGAIWGYVAERRLRVARPYRSRLPVICVGNFTAGGTGKTPLCLFLAGVLKQQGHRPVFLTRGYGSEAREPSWVDPDFDTAARVGDEPLILAQAAPVMVARDRAAGARVIEAAGQSASVIIMDDGLQNPRLAKDLTFAVVDAGRGIGNGRVIPAGPLRASLDVQLGLVDAVIINDAGSGLSPGLLEQLRQTFAGPIVMAETQASGDTQWLRGARVTAYCGIGNPARFFGLLQRLGADVVAQRSYPDHHVFRDDEARQLMQQADASASQLVTTVKDSVRLTGAGEACQDLQARSRTLPVEVLFGPSERALVDQLLAKLPRP